MSGSNSTGGWLSRNIGRIALCVAYFAVAAVVPQSRAEENPVAGWDDPASDASRWDQAWLDERRRRATGGELDSRAAPNARGTLPQQDMPGFPDTSAIDMLWFPDGSARPSLDAGMLACGERPEQWAGADCFPSIFDAYYSERLPAIRQTEGLPLGSSLPHERAGPVVGSAGGDAFAAASDDEISIPDAGLRAAIVARLRKSQDDPITEADMAGMTTLTAVGRGISDLSGLRYATGLQRLNLRRNDISDLYELRALTELTHLYIDENFIHDVAPLRNLTKLRALSLADNLVRYIEPLAGLTELRVLDIGSNDVDVPAWLQSLGALTHLYLNDNRIEGLWDLENLRNLRVLDLRNNLIQSVAPLSALSRLTILYLSENHVGDISSLSGLASLRRLSLRGSGVSDISPLARLGKLTHLDLGGNFVTDLSPVSTLSELTLLDLGGNDIVEISALADLTKLALLDLAANRVADASPLSGLADLAAVDLSGNQLTHAPAALPAGLQRLSLGSNRIADLSPLTDLTGLKTLHLFNNAIRDISPLSGLGRLDTLILNLNEITDISPLSGLTDLALLSLWNNSLVDISPLGSLLNLRTLGLGSNEIEELPDLSRLHRLRSLSVFNNRISNIQAMSMFTGLRYLVVDRNGIADLRPLSTLERLEVLSVGENEIYDLSPLEALSNLYALYAADNAIEDASPVAGLTGLILLDLRGNGVADLSPLSGLRWLSRLWLTGNEIVDIAPLVDNADFGAGDYVNLRKNPLDPSSLREKIPALRDRGVVVRLDAPDLVVDSPSASDNDLQTGASFTVSTTVRNEGAESAPATTLRYYRSADSTIGTGDSEVGIDKVDRLLGSETSAESIRLTAPSTAGTYYYGACVEAVAGETDADNNCSSGVRVTVRSTSGGAPDLVVDTPTVDDANPGPGDRVVVRATVRNRGAADSATTVLRWFRSDNSTISDNDTRVGTDTVSSLEPSSTSPESVTVTVPSQAGTYYYGACVDAVSDESNTSNNCSVGVEVEVSDDGADSYCRDDDIIGRGEKCDVYSTDAYFEVNSGGQACTRNVPGISDFCVGSGIRIQGGNVRIYADRSGSGYKIVDVEPEPDD